MSRPVGVLVARRLTVKVGSALLVDERGELRRAWLDSLAADIAELRAGAREIIVVTSGAIALGRRVLGLVRRGERLDLKQAAAAAGQILQQKPQASGLTRGFSKERLLHFSEAPPRWQDAIQVERHLVVRPRPQGEQGRPRKIRLSRPPRGELATPQGARRERIDDHGPAAL